MQRVIVLNQDMSILGTTSWKRAFCLVSAGKAEVLKESLKKIHPKHYLPLVIRLIKAIRNLWRAEVPWAKGNIHLRDNYSCRYCGKKLESKDVTIDHIIPRDRGGKNTWENCVTSCFPCNNKKDNRTPNEARMVLLTKPYKPTIGEFIMKKVKREGLEGILKELKIY